MCNLKQQGVTVLDCIAVATALGKEDGAPVAWQDNDLRLNPF